MIRSLFNVLRQAPQRNQTVASLLLFAGIVVLGSMQTAAAAPITWHGNNGTNPTFWDIGTTPNWNGSATNYAEGDAVTFDNTAVGYTVSIQPAAVNPVSMSISGGTAYSFSGGSISGATSIAHSGTAMATFSNNSLAFAGGTVLSNSGDITYSPTTAGAKSFGSAPIQLNNAGASFIYTPTTAGSTLTNDFVINAPVTWDRQSTNGTRTGTVTVNSNFNMRSDGAFPSVMEANMLLTGDRTISGSLYFNIPTISGQITSSGIKRSITFNNTGDNPGWFVFISSPTPGGWDVKDIIHNATAGAREATLRVTGDERDFFDNMEANGGYLKILTAGVEFARAANAEIGFDIIINPQSAGAGVATGTGIRGNSSLSVVNGGGLHGTGIYRSGVPGCCTGTQPFNNPLDISVSGTGLISPGDPTAVSPVGIMTINGDLAFAGGQLRIDVLTGNGVAGTDFDRLVVQDAPAAGSDGAVTGINSATLVIDFHNVSFDDLNGDVMTILTSSLSNFTGQQFGTVTTLNMGDYFAKVLYGNGFIQLSVISTIPEPSTATMLGLGLVGFAMRRRRRKRAV